MSIIDQYNKEKTQYEEKIELIAEYILNEDIHKL